MKISKISWNLVIWLALIEGISLFVLDLNAFSFLIGFIPALLVLLIYELNPIKINNQKITKLPVLYLSLVNGLFIFILFNVQKIIEIFINKLFIGIFGFLSVLLAFLILVLIYNNIKIFRIKFKLNNKKVALKHLDYCFVLYAGLFEFFILPLMKWFYSINLHIFVNGALAGLIGSSIALLIVNYILKKKPLILIY